MFFHLASNMARSRKSETLEGIELQTFEIRALLLDH